MIQDDGATVGVNINPNSAYQMYISTSINDGTLALDSSASVNAMYFLTSGTKKFEVSYDSAKIFRLLPYQSSSFFQIGNPANAANSNTDYVFISESTYGNVMIGPGLANGLGNLSGATAATHKVQIKGAAFFNSSIDASSLTTSGAISCASLAASGSITAGGDIIGYYSSDRRFKDNIVKIDKPLEKISSMNGVTWEWNDNVQSDVKNSSATGLIAQEVQSVFPDVVKERADGYLALDYQKMAGLFVESIKELHSMVLDLHKEIEKIKNA
jgi:hypothetical protein